jgi:hypothetical protein
MNEIPNTPPSPPSGTPVNPFQEALDLVLYILKNPKDCWPRLRSDPRDIPQLYSTYLIPLVGVSAICQFIGQSMVGVPVPLVGTIRVPVISAFISCAMTAAIQLAVVYFGAWLMEQLAPKFNGSAPLEASFKLLAFSMTPGLVAGVLGIYPPLMMLGLFFGLYSLYLLWVGLPAMIDIPAEKRVPFLAAVVVASMAIGIVSLGIVGMVI